MDILIISKWLTDWDAVYPGQGIAKSPSIISAMISMFLHFGELNTDKELPIIQDQTTYCRLMFGLALITPPWMLLTKPLLMKKEHEDKMK